MADITTTMLISAAGMKAQSDRIRVASENIANADSIGEKPGDLPYRRKLVTFQEALDKENMVNLVQSKKIIQDDSDFKLKYQPYHPMSNAEGYVSYPNVDTTIESADIMDAMKTYNANLSALESSKNMISRTVDLLR